MARRLVAGVDYIGPFFAHDPAKTFNQNAEHALEELAASGERNVKARMAGIGTGRTASRVTGRVHSLGGKQWHRTAVVSPSITGLGRKDAISVYAAASEIESQTHAFKRATADMRKFAKQMGTELLKGLT